MTTPDRIGATLERLAPHLLTIQPMMYFRSLLEELVDAAQDDLLADLRGTQDAARAWGVTRIRAARHIARLHELYGIGQLVGGAWVLRQAHIDANPPDARYRRKT